MNIKQHYKNYKPPLDYAPYMERVISTLPESATKGLGLILLRDSSSLGRGEARERLVSGAAVKEASGVYYRSHKGTPARIDLFLDTIIGMWPGWIVYVPMFRYEIVGRIFFHELGHHIFAKRHPTAASNEKEATAIGKALFSNYLRTRYKRWLPVIHPLRWIYWLLSKIVLRRDTD